jgi:lipid-binding SYLF domain-containing protein
MHRHVQFTAVALATFVCLHAHTLATGKAASTSPSSDEEDRIQNSLVVLSDLTAKPENAIPRSVLQRAVGIVVIPSLKKGGFIIGAKHGRGVMSVREGEKAAWSSPAFVTMSGGTIGWQIGVESVDLVMLVMTRDGVEDLLQDRFKLGGNASVAAGPVGAGTDSSGDSKPSSHILVYSRQRGLFAGATLEGASLNGDKDANTEFYGKPVSVKGILLADEPEGAHPPKIAETWRKMLRSLVSPQN